MITAFDAFVLFCLRIGLVLLQAVFRCQHTYTKACFKYFTTQNLQMHILKYVYSRCLQMCLFAYATHF